MNLTKTERLLAAKKKLKEFQMSKMMQQNDSPDQQSSHYPSKKYIPGVSYNGRPLEEFYANHYPEKLNSLLRTESPNVTAPSQSTISTENFATSNTNRGDNWNKLDGTSENVSIGTHSPDDAILEEVENKYPGTQQQNKPVQQSFETHIQSVKAENNEGKEPVPECSFFKNMPVQDFPAAQTVPQKIQESQQIMHSLEKDLNLGKVVESEAGKETGKSESFPVQKEHLLEMATAVENALTNSDASEPLDSELSYRNQFLNSYLEEQKKIVNSLHLEISTYRSRVSELEAKLSSREAEFEAQLAREVKPLKEQLQLHAQTTGILIAERAELSASLSQTQQTMRRTCEEIEELSGKLKQSQGQVSELEKDLSTLRAVNEELRKSNQKQKEELDLVQEKMHNLRAEKEEATLEASELRQKLNLRKTELVSVRQELQEKTALLSLSELTLQQMKEPQNTADEERSRQLEKELEEARKSLRTVTEEKEFLAQQYQAYVKWLDAEKARMVSSTTTMQQEYAQKVQHLEHQLQGQFDRKDRKKCKEEEKAMEQDANSEHEDDIKTSLSSSAELQAKLEQLDQQVMELTEERNELMKSLALKAEEAEGFRIELNRIQEERQERDGEVSRLVKALESEQLAASRAVSQNHQLKEQLTEMENAFVSLSNEELKLTEQLQAERSIGRKLNIKLNSVEAELESCKEKLREQEATLNELEKERLQHAQLADQMQHYQAQGHNAQTYQLELQNALVRIDKMEKEKDQLIDRLEKEKLELVERLEKEKRELIEKLEREKPQLVQTVERAFSEEQSTDPVQQQVTDNAQQVDHCDGMTDIMKKLQDRFKDTMERVAELTEEKQELEHLVMQLQSETETIGEYIALYQKQRAVLQGRAREREQVFRQLLDQRNQLQEQLHRLKLHVSDFLRKEVMKTEKNGPPMVQLTADRVTEPSLDETPEEEIAKNKDVSELMDLLTEIKDCKDSCMFESNFHPCPWCSGKLLTV